MMRKEFEKRKEKYKIGVMAGLLAGCCLVLYYFHVSLETGTIVTHIFYIPIIFAAIWWKRKGLIVAGFSSAFLVFSHVFLRPDVTTANDYLRVLMFMVIGFVTAKLSEHIARGKEALQAANQQLSASERQLRVQHEFLKNTIDSLAYPFYVIDADDYTVKIANSTAIDSADLKEGTKCYELIYRSDKPCSHPQHSCPLAEIKRTKETCITEHVQFDKDGNKRIFEVRGYPVFDKDENVSEMIEYFVDITERIRAEEKVKASEQQLRGSNQQLVANEQQLRAANQQLRANEQQLRADIAERKRAEEERKRFLKALSAKNKELQSVIYVASHDLRTPLVNIQGFAGELAKSCSQLSELLKGKDADKALKRKTAPLLDEDIPESLKFINAGAGMMSRLLDGLLRISRIGSAEIKIETIEMNQLMKNVQHSLEFQIQQSGATVRLKKLPGCYGDVSLLNQVFSNLLDNAIKYLDNKRKGEITISGRVEDNNSIYCVEDNGIGIDRKHQEKVFEIFHRLNPEGQVAGEGLGLSAVWRMLSRLDGTILVESEPGKGSRFLVTLPNSK